MIALQMAKTKAMFNEMLKQSHQFRENTALRHGMHQPESATEVDDKDIERYLMMQSQEPEKLPEQPKIEQNVDIQDGKKGLSQTIGLPLALATGMLGAGYLIGEGLSSDDKKTTVPPVVIPNIVQPIDEKTGNLLKYLEDEGYNLPPTNGR